MSEPAQDSNDRDPAQRRRQLLILGGVVLLAAIGAVLYWLHARQFESTDDAYIQTDIVRIAPKIAGTVLRVPVIENQHVSAGELLAEIDPADYRVQMEQARANVAAAEARVATARSDLHITETRGGAELDQAQAGLRAARANLERTQADLVRYRALYAKDEVPRQLLDQAEAAAKTAAAQYAEAESRLRDAGTAPQQVEAKQAALRNAEAQLAQAQAALSAAELQLSYTQITAPQAGKVTKKSVLPGSQVGVGSAMMAVVADAPWVIANFKETQVSLMKPGQPVEIAVDAYPDQTFHGRVQSLQAGTGSVFSLLPPENATGNFVKVVQRIPVKLVFDPPPGDERPLLPGMSVVPTVRVRD